jgi:hypothetical protein
MDRGNSRLVCSARQTDATSCTLTNQPESISITWLHLDARESALGSERFSDNFAASG